MAKNNVVLLEDDPVLGQSLETVLQESNYETRWYKSVQDCREGILGEEPDLAIFDVDLPDGSGIEFVSELRALEKQYPIIILTAFTGEHFVVQGLQSGANDYLRKPLGHNELIARVMTHLRIVPTPKTSNELIIDRSQRLLSFGDRTCSFNLSQINLLEVLYQSIDQIVKRETLAQALESEKVEQRTIDSHLSQIRKKLREAGIREIKIGSVYGMGYRLEKK